MKHTNIENVFPISDANVDHIEKRKKLNNYFLFLDAMQATLGEVISIPEVSQLSVNHLIEEQRIRSELPDKQMEESVRKMEKKCKTNGRDEENDCGNASGTKRTVNT